MSAPAEGLRVWATDARAKHRLPALAIGVGHQGVPLGVEAVGSADVSTGRAAEPTTQFRIGSITKTFTAAVTLLLGQRGVLNLDRSVESYLPGTPLGAPRLRQLLAHCGGVQREAPLPMWSTMCGPDDETLLASLGQARMVDAPGVRWHYSNLGYAVLGQIIRLTTGQRCEDLIDAELIGPLGLQATTWQPGEDAGCGYRLDPFIDAVHVEPVMDQGAIGVGGQLWSTPGDLLTWGHALLGGAPEVLPRSVVEAMHTPQVMVDRRDWTQGWGQGLILDRRDGRILSGHTGAMPGFLAALSLDRDTATVVTCLTNVTRGIPLAGFTAQIMRQVQQQLPVTETRARQQVPCPKELESVLGDWWCEAEVTVFTWQDGCLQAHLAATPDSSRTTFTAEGPDSYVAAGGRLQGEQLHIVRDEAGTATGLEWATYPYARDPR